MHIHAHFWLQVQLSLCVDASTMPVDGAVVAQVHAAMTLSTTSAEVAAAASS